MLKDGFSSCFQFSTKMKNENFRSFSFFIFQILRKMNWHSGTRIETALKPTTTDLMHNDVTCLKSRMVVVVMLKYKMEPSSDYLGGNSKTMESTASERSNKSPKPLLNRPSTSEHRHVSITAI